MESPWGSSLGGEQPKFTTAVIGEGHTRRCIVKFSPTLDTPGGRRWADLLTAEHLVHEVLRAHGVDAARSRLVEGPTRRFLEVERFDRHGERGRSGLVSLRSLRQGRLRAEDQARVEWLEAFGHLIANTDMHPANLSLQTRGTTLLGLAPVYDMLPMFHAPRHGGELPTGIYEPRSERIVFPASARAAARDVWERLLSRPDVSDAFKAIAEQQAARVP